jgi:hypothetical protein
MNLTEVQSNFIKKTRPILRGDLDNIGEDSMKKPAYLPFLAPDISLTLCEIVMAAGRV